MEKGLKIILGVMVVLVVGLILMGFFGKEDKLIVETNGLSDNDYNPGTCEFRCSGDEVCILSCGNIDKGAIVSAGDISACSDKDCEDDIIFKKARDTKDASLCDTLNNKDKVEGCKLTVSIL